ncbi:homocysteine S-methyltransferase [Nocardioides anomalus]|uniref:Homocysteine S-methyltransferase n=1 Tax=Nocardioides anomalus TaxID=2712223 RepID=A0A6G6WCT0_9ACTN|nr:homocysteine S-methyltransferase family protein [Nocardioides anomalus]QIG42905.1 homocysteine S-methyltransferase [Nocardioides anomalus]
MELLAERRWVTDGGLETDLIFHHGVDLPEFAAFPLVEDEGGRALLTDYYEAYAAIAARAGAGLLLESPTWRANPDWGARLGYDAADLDRVNRAAVALMHERREAHPELEVLVGGIVGPRGDGYVAGDRLDPAAYAEHHRPQLASVRAADADLATALTLTGADEAMGIVAAARDVGIPVAIGFTVETDGRLPDGTALAQAVATVDAAGGPDWYLVNCAHPSHVAPALEGDGPWHRVAGLRPNASRASHAELDQAEELDDGDPEQLSRDCQDLAGRLPGLRVLGGCCGTDARHVAALWGV